MASALRRGTSLAATASRPHHQQQQRGRRGVAGPRASAEAQSTTEWDNLGTSDVNPVDEEVFNAVTEDKHAAVTSERQQIFQKIAPLNDWLSLGQHRVVKRGDSVLDICCGSGDLSLIAAEKVGQQGKVVGLDFSSEQLAVAARRQKDSYFAKSVPMEWLEGNALNLPFGDASFDAVTMGYGLRNVADIPRSLREIVRVLKPGSTAAIIDFNKSTDPITNAFQGFMLDNVVVPIAKQFGVEAEYTYLRPSIERFLTGQEQVSAAKEAGFAKAVHYEIGGGLMGVLVATKI
eukprot:jgi/Mesen1/5395/ME000268S04589